MDVFDALAGPVFLIKEFDALFTFFIFGLTSHIHPPVTGENR